MKEKFKAYNKRTQVEAKELWNNSLITFDTSALMHLYRLPKERCDNFFKLIKLLIEDSFITYHVALELHKNRFNAISDAISQHNSFLKELEDYQNSIAKGKIYDLLEKDTKDLLENEIKAKKDEVKARRLYVESLEHNDLVYENIANIFGPKLEEEFSEKEIDEIKKEGQTRYKNKKPPGYEDAGKTNGNEFGDLIIWKEILRKAKKSKRSIILVTNDNKEDWYWIQKNDKTIGARPELIQEIHNEASVDFMITSLKNFFLSASDKLDQPIKSDELKKEFKFESIIEGITIKPQKNINEKISDLYSQRKFVLEQINEINKKPQLDEVSNKKLENLNFHLLFINEEISKLQSNTTSKS